jgi:23S rRNA (uridine2552-2'-O)-methyltransferase
MRELKVKVKTARGRTVSSTRWLARQLNDPYVKEARNKGYRSRSAFKLIDIDSKFKILKEGQRVLDLGCSPGGWCQVASDKVKSTSSDVLVYGVDIKECEPIMGVDFEQFDFLDEIFYDKYTNELAGKFDIILSDMAPNATGHKQTDNLKIIALVEAAIFFGLENLVVGGSFVAKVLDAGVGAKMQNLLKKRFQRVINFKPSSSRSSSSEKYLIAIGLKN